MNQVNKREKKGANCTAASPVAAIHRAIHTALGEFHQVFRLRKASGQA